MMGRPCSKPQRRTYTNEILPSGLASRSTYCAAADLPAGYATSTSRNVIEELEGLTKRDQRSLQSLFTSLAVHVLKLSISLTSLRGLGLARLSAALKGCAEY